MRLYTILFLPFVKCVAELQYNMTFVYVSETIPQPFGTDCESKGMQRCGSTGPNVCWEQNVTCPGYRPYLRTGK